MRAALSVIRGSNAECGTQVSSGYEKSLHTVRENIWAQKYRENDVNVAGSNASRNINTM